MSSKPHSRWAVHGASFALWAMAAASAVFWGLRLTAPAGGPVDVPAAAPTPVPADPQAVAKLLGASPAGPAAAQPLPSLASRFALVGVVAGPSGKGAALIAVDGKPAKPFPVGSTLEDGLVLQSVAARRAVLAASAGGPPALTLELPPLRR